MQPALRLPEPAEPDSGILEEEQRRAGSDLRLWGSHAVLLMGTRDYAACYGADAPDEKPTVVCLP